MSQELPIGWSVAKISDISQFVTSGSRGWGKYYSSEGPRFIRVGDFCRNSIELNLEGMAHVQPPAGAEGRRTSVQLDDVMLTITADIGMAAVAQENLGEAYVNQHVALIRLLPGQDGRAFAYGLLDPVGLQRLVRASQYGATKPGLSLIQVRDFELKVPPLPEQHRIVGALDSYLSRLDSAEEGLKRVETNLKRYRASILKAAVEGRLVPTEAELARQEGRDYEPASVLLERILKERRRHWEEAELAKMKAKGKVPRNDKWKAKYKEPVGPDASELPPVPMGWCWATVDQIGLVQGGIQKGKKRKGDEQLREIPYLRVANVQRGFLNLDEVKCINATEAEIDKLRLQEGDILFNEGGDRDKLGRGWIWSGEISECIHQNHVFRVRMFTESLLPKLLSWYGNSVGQRYFFDEGKQTTNLASLNSTKLRHLPVPLPPRSEQLVIEAEVERLLSKCAMDEAALERSTFRISRVRQSILKWAFEGKLVDQDPDDEPASVLLERIKKQRQAKPSKRRGTQMTLDL